VASEHERLDAALRRWAEDHGVRVLDRDLGPEKPGAFDGPTIVLNPGYGIETRCFVLAHSIGSVVVWTLEKDRSQRVYDELREAKKTRTDRGRYDRALADWSAFEEATHECAVGLLRELRHDWAIEPYTEFARADLEMMLAFHREGRAPVWREFFAAWRERLARGEVEARTFKVRTIPPEFRPVHFPPQEVYREEDGRLDP
jgi:hypothetical protein